jgi:ribosomal protein S18 acetylase RimI-like enzyme
MIPPPPQQPPPPPPTAAGVTLHRLAPHRPDPELIASLLALERRLWSKAESWGAALAQELQRRNTFLLYALAADQPDQPLAGFVVFTAHGLVAHICKLLVVPSLRRRGIGRALVQAALAVAGERRVGSATLHVAAANAGALALYVSLGFACEAGVLQDYYGAGRHAHKMRLALTEDY